MSRPQTEETLHAKPETRPASNKRSTPRNAPGWVYAVRIKQQSPVKIGLTYGKTPYQRLTEIQQALPYPVVLIGFVWTENARKMEESLHQLFAHRRMRGEWFRLERSEITLLIETAGLHQRKPEVPDPEEWTVSPDLELAFKRLDEMNQRKREEILRKSEIILAGLSQ